MSDAPPLKLVRIEWESDQDFHFPLATNMVVNFDNEHFYIRFYQASPPAVLGEELPDVVKAKLVAGVAIPTSKLRGVVEALSENYDRYTEREREDVDFGLDEPGDRENENG